MPKYRVFFATTASLSVEVELDDEEIERHGGDAKSAAIEKAYDAMPGDICAQCSGWGRNYSLELGEFEIETQRKVDDEGDTILIETEPTLIEDNE